MLTIQHRYYDRMQQAYAESQYSFKEKPEQVIESKPSSEPKKIPELDRTELVAKIRKINEENEYIRRENLFFSRYLLRINSTKIVETFDQYEDENDIILETLDQSKSSNTTRRFAMNRSSSYTKKSTPGWTKVLVNWGEHAYTPYILRLEQERFIIAAYEAEQTRLEWERMHARATVALYHLEVVYQSIKSDEIAQGTLNRELERRVDRYRADVGEKQFNSPYMHVPGELVVSRINKRIQSRISLIGLLRVNTARLRIRLGEVNAKIRASDDINDKIDEVDIVSMRTRRIDHRETYEKVDRTYRLVKSSQYPLFRRLQDDRNVLYDAEKHIDEMKKKYDLLHNHLERTIQEIICIQEEYGFILEENQFLKNRIADVMKVPAITEYAHVTEQTKVLQHGIDIWTRRVQIAEAALSQLQRQKKPPRRLPPLQSTDVNGQL